jgi:hypothetical protein
MNPEQKSNNVEVPSRAELHDAIAQYPNSVLLSQVDSLSKDAYSALYYEYNKGDFTFNDFALFEEDNNSEMVSGLLQRLETAEDEVMRREVSLEIAKELVK